MVRVRCFQTIGYKCNSVEFSPFDGNHLAVVGGRNFGLSGQGSLHLLEKYDYQNEVKDLARTNWRDALFDVTWSEHSPNVFATAAGDGKVLLWKYESKLSLVSVLMGHEKEVSSVEWNIDRQEACLLSASWDHSIKLWSPLRTEPIQALDGHLDIVHCVRWSPQMPGVFISSSADGTNGLFDIRSGSQRCQKFYGFTQEVLTCDWTKYNQNIFVSAGTDSLIRVWDLRRMCDPFALLHGHKYPVKRIKCSPHNQNCFATVSYDMTTMFWDFGKQGGPINILKNHTEFTTGLDFNIHKDGEVADCAWDETVKVFSQKVG